MVTLAQPASTGEVFLTARGRFVVTGILVAALGLCAVLMWIQQPKLAAVAADHHDRNVTQYQRLVVQPGDTLWEISARLAQDSSRTDVFDQILKYNDLEDSELDVGQTLFVPVVQ